MKRDFLIVEAGISGGYDFTAGWRRLQLLTGLIQGHPWWATTENPMDARMALIRAAKAALPEGFPEMLPEEMPPAPDQA